MLLGLNERDAGVIVSKSGRGQVLGSGSAPGPGAGTWHALALGLHHDTLTARIDGRVLARVTDHAWRTGLAGIESNWGSVQFRDLTVR